MDKLEIIPARIILSNYELISKYENLAAELRKGLGWHYLLDLAWTELNLNPVPNMYVLDAGAGFGLIQWAFAEMGIDVISVDRINREKIPRIYWQKYSILGYRKSDFKFTSIQKLLKILFELSRDFKKSSKLGTIYIYNQDLSNLIDIPGDSLDAVVAISALEHNSPDQLRKIVNELMRVIKTGGLLIATLAAAKEKDWFHEPSQGWCYTEATLRSAFDLAVDYDSNFDKFDTYFDELYQCEYLKIKLDDYYFTCGNNGMPWGIWNPKYQPVGVVKQKP